MNVTKKFDPKKYQGKPRVYPPVAGAPNVRRLWNWDKERSEYIPNSYEARRYDVASDGRKTRVKHSFPSLEEARKWQGRLEEKTAVPKPGGPLFAEVVEEWKKRVYSSLAESTRVAYDKGVRLYFGSLLPLSIHELTPQRIDQWIDELKEPAGRAMKSSRRRAFEHELALLSTVLKYYNKYHDDPAFRFPVKERHREATVLNRPKPPRSKDLSQEEFYLFRQRLSEGPYGEVMAAMATVQYFQALRISEAAGLYWEDLRLDGAEPSRSRMNVVRYVCWPRKKGSPSFVQYGFKNSGTNGGIKEHPLFPGAFEAIAKLYRAGAKGLVFGLEGAHLEYRQIQYAYDKAFKAAGLPYTATHVMRHGGCRRLYNVASDLEVAKQHLGNSSVQSTLVYAKRSAAALTKVALAEWEKYETGRNWSQTIGTRLKIQSI